MGKYFCSFCEKKLLISTYKARKTHNSGNKHKIIKKAYFLEILEQENIRDELDTAFRNLKYVAENIENKRCYVYVPPPCNFPKNFTIPDPPGNFKLPSNFDFYDRNNFHPDINQAIKKIIDKNKKNKEYIG